MKVLYICTGNSYRSPTAEALTRKYHPELEVESSGTHKADGISEVALEQLETVDALEYVKPSPDQVSQRALEEADLIVCMMPRHKEFIQENFDIDENEIQIWNLEDPINPGVGAEIVFEELKDKVKEMKK